MMSLEDHEKNETEVDTYVQRKTADIVYKKELNKVESYYVGADVYDEAIDLVKYENLKIEVIKINQNIGYSAVE